MVLFQQITRERMNNEMDLSFKNENVKEIQIQINLSVHSWNKIQLDAQ